MERKANNPRKLNVYFYGGGQLTRLILTHLKLQSTFNGSEPVRKWGEKHSFVSYVGLHAHLVREVIHPVYASPDYSYEDIERSVGTHGFKEHYGNYTTLDEWAEDVKKDGDVVILASGPHAPSYDVDGKSLRDGRGGGGINEENFHQSMPWALKVGRALRGYEGLVYMLSNPVGPLLSVFRHSSQMDPSLLTSPTPDGVRSSMLLEGVLERCRLPAKKVTPEIIQEFPIIGEHHNPRPVFELCELLVGGHTYSLEDRHSDFKEGHKVSSNLKSFREDLATWANRTAKSSKRLREGMGETPEVVASSLESLAFGNQLKPEESYYCFVEELGAYLQFPLMKESFPNTFSPAFSLDDFVGKFSNPRRAKNARKFLEKEARSQRELIGNYIDLE